MDRHPKWVRVEPGAVIPAGQPYRAEYENGTAREWPGNAESHVFYDPGEDVTGIFIDSLWKPPLDLPTEPTWGIAVTAIAAPELGRWVDVNGAFRDETDGLAYFTDRVLDFIPLTDEQVARIEAAR